MGCASSTADAGETSAHGKAPKGRWMRKAKPFKDAQLPAGGMYAVPGQSTLPMWRPHAPTYDGASYWGNMQAQSEVRLPVLLGTLLYCFGLALAL